MVTTTIDRWHALVRSRDASALDALLADDVVFLSPVVHMPQVGRRLALAYLRAALQVLGDPSFRYVGEWLGADSAVLEFSCTLDGVEVNGVDLIHWDADGRIDRFKVMLRPLRAIQKVHEHMAQLLAPAAAPPHG